MPKETLFWIKPEIISWLVQHHCVLCVVHRLISPKLDIICCRARFRFHFARARKYRGFSRLYCSDQPKMTCWKLGNCRTNINFYQRHSLTHTLTFAHKLMQTREYELMLFLFSLVPLSFGAVLCWAQSFNRTRFVWLKFKWWHIRSTSEESDHKKCAKNFLQLVFASFVYV